MNLYRLDYEGVLTGTSVVDMLGPVLVRVARRALALAADEASAHGVPVRITRISGAGTMRAMSRVHPSGRIERLPR